MQGVSKVEAFLVLGQGLSYPSGRFGRHGWDAKETPQRTSDGFAVQLIDAAQNPFRLQNHGQGQEYRVALQQGSCGCCLGGGVVRQCAYDHTRIEEITFRPPDPVGWPAAFRPTTVADLGIRQTRLQPPRSSVGIGPEAEATSPLGGLPS